MLERMGAAADTPAYNEVLHLHRVSGDFGAAEALWTAMGERGVTRDALSYYHLLHMLQLYKPVTWEYSRLNLTHAVMSKR